MIKNYHSNGKLLLTGEYVVLNGALALAVPTKLGQSLEVENSNTNGISWTALDHRGLEWFSIKFNYFEGKLTVLENNASTEIGQKLREVLLEADKLNPGIFRNSNGFMITTRLGFPQDWGLGSSSTLVNNIAQWFEADAYKLLENTFGGSGYDIAAAQNDLPFTFEKAGNENRVLVSAFDPHFKDKLFFVHLNKKQNSRSSIAHYKEQPKDFLEENIAKISAVTQSIITCSSLQEFKLLLEIHETLISRIINTPKIKTSHFPDFPGSLKSLGGWGGDFILATGGEVEKRYFRNKGFTTIVAYEEMVK